MLADLRGLEEPLDVGERRRGGLARVVPALEGADHHRARRSGGLARSHRSSTSRYPTSDPALTIGAVTIAELRAGGEVEGVFACTRKDRLTAKNGAPYLAVELRDRTGAIPAAPSATPTSSPGQFERGDLVAVRGRVERFRDELQVELRAIRRAPRRRRRPRRVPAGGLPRHGGARRLPRAPRARGVRRRPARAARRLPRRRGLPRRLRRAPCTRAGHHAYLGGLLEHTVAVATLAHETCVLHPRLNSDLLLCAAILHDIGKMREFELGARDRAQRGGRAGGPRRARPAARGRARARGSTASPRQAARALSLHAGPPRARRRCPAGASARPRRWRSTA